MTWSFIKRDKRLTLKDLGHFKQWKEKNKLKKNTSQLPSCDNPNFSLFTFF